MNHHNTDQARFSVSSWSLHRHLGQPQLYGVESGHNIPVASHNQGEFALLELPQRIADFGIHTLEICHFHLPSLDAGYLTELRQALTAANVELFSLLVDDGDITHPEHGERDLAWIDSWVEVAAALGSKCMRVIAGKQPTTPENLQLSQQRLERLWQTADSHNIRLMTENWFPLLATPAAVKQLFEAMNGRIGLCLDFGNWRGEEKYAGFEQIATYAESCHAKGQFNEKGQLHRDDYGRCLDITRAASFAGPYTLIYDSPHPTSQWDGLAIEKEMVSLYI
ncbi:MAG: sugar phosphate isomerase/epimerase [Ardenticatenaceae bacterium]|nr:sugar phosphate isomerase/epimerase [Ardenticatenaceae bacterium]